MNRNEWLKHRADVYLSLGLDPATFAPENFRVHRGADGKACKLCNARGRSVRANRNAKDRNDALRSLGLTKTPFGWE